MRDWSWSEAIGIILMALIFLGAGFCLGYLKGGIDMVRHLYP